MTSWDSPVPLHRQLRDRLVAEILEGALVEGATAPSVRQVASEAAVNPLTVAKAYQALADAGVLERRRGLGMIVAPGARARLLAEERERFLATDWPVLQSRLKRLGLSHLLKDVP